MKQQLILAGYFQISVDVAQSQTKTDAKDKVKNLSVLHTQ